ncbi:MAG: T9SS type A sorting domain-containing protein [Bacteroidota bacterium]
MKFATFTHSVFAILLFVPFALMAQPTITDSSNPVPGQTYGQQDALSGGMGPGSDAPSSTWDFSMLVPDEDPYFFSVDVAANSAFADSFPEATLFSDLGEDSVAFFVKGSSSALEILGSIAAFQDEETMEVDTFVLKYTDPQTIISYPFGVSSSVDDTYKFGLDLFGLGSNSSTGTQTQEGSGHGTLTTPAGTFENVLRMKTTTVEIDSLDFAGLFTTVTTTYSTQYTWHLPGEFNILMTWSRDSSFDDTFGASVDTTVSYGLVTSSTSISKTLASEISLGVYPSPMANDLSVEFELLQSDLVSVSLFDLSGRSVIALPEERYAQGANLIQLPVGNMAAGTYFLSMEVGDKRLIKKVQKQ